MTSLRSQADQRWNSIVFISVGFVMCLLWTIGTFTWPGLRDPSRVTSVLTTLATISAASIVLGLSVALVGLQMLSRYGSRASRIVIAQPVVASLILVDGIFGVALPVWATIEPWHWLARLGFAAFSWGILALAIASYLILSRLNPCWLTLRLVNKEFPLAMAATDALFTRLGELQSTLLEIAAGTAESESGWPVTLRAIALVDLARYRIDAKNAGLFQFVDTMTERTRSPSNSSGPPEAKAAVLSLLALSSDDSDVTLAVVKALRKLVHDAIQQHQPVRPSLLDEIAGLVTDHLLVLVAPATIDWIAAQRPSDPPRGVLFPMPEAHVVTWEAIRTWLTRPSAPERSEWKTLSDLVPRYEQEDKHVPEETVELIDVSSMVEPDAAQLVPESSEGDVRHRDDHGIDADNSTPDPALDEVEEEERSPEARAAIVEARHRHSAAYDLQVEGVSLLMSACAAPTPDDTTWPGGWRGVDALQEDIQRLSSISVSLYESGRYPLTDRVEQTIETIAARVVRERRSEPHADELSNVTGWRVGETTLERTTASAATEALRELAIAAWRAGFARRALLTIRRLVSIITVVTQSGDPKLLDDLGVDLRLSVIRTACWTGDCFAERERSRQLVFNLAPEFIALGKAVQPHTDEKLWSQVFATLDTIAWSPAGGEIEAATSIYLYFLSGIGTGNALSVGRPWDVVAWERSLKCQPQKLLPKVREHLLHELRFNANSEQPGIALLAVLALWRDLLVQDDRPALKAFRDALAEDVIKKRRRCFELPILWSPRERIGDIAPKFEGPLIDGLRIHWRLFDVAKEAHRWACAKLGMGESVAAVLPPVTTPDADLRSLITTFGAERLVTERQYWGIESGDVHFVLVQEADRSRRLLRDCEGRARAQFTWGYGGTGPDNLGAVLVADMLGPLVYCPSCFGAISAGAGLVGCPSCDGTGFRQNDLGSLHRACYHVIASLPKKSDPSLQDSEDVPPGAQWQLSRVEFLQGAFAMVDELVAEE